MSDWNLLSGDAVRQVRQLVAEQLANGRPAPERMHLRRRPTFEAAPPLFATRGTELRLADGSISGSGTAITYATRTYLNILADGDYPVSGITAPAGNDPFTNGTIEFTQAGYYRISGIVFGSIAAPSGGGSAWKGITWTDTYTTQSGGSPAHTHNHTGPIGAPIQGYILLASQKNGLPAAPETNNPIARTTPYYGPANYYALPYCDYVEAEVGDTYTLVLYRVDPSNTGGNYMDVFMNTSLTSLEVQYLRAEATNT